MPSLRSSLDNVRREALFPNETMSTPPATDEATGRVRRHYDRTATKYNRQISLFERVLFGDGRQWVCSQASGDVLEIAIGTGRNPR